MKGTVSTPWNLFLLLCLLAMLAYGGSFVWYMLDSLDLPHLLHMMYDDSFYYFKIAKNLAEGKFSTFDGGITRTNGYHPFWMLLITPFYWLLDPEAALFGIKAFEIMLVAGAVVMIVLAAHTTRLHWILLFALLPALYELHNPLLVGLECAAAVFMLGALFLALGLFAQSPENRNRKWPLAVVAFILPWVRLEHAAISLVATVSLCVIEWSRRDKPPGISATRARERSFATLSAIVPLLAAVAGLLSYFVYNGLVFGASCPSAERPK